MNEKRSFLKAILLAAIPTSFATRALGVDPSAGAQQSNILAILLAKIKKLESIGEHQLIVPDTTDLKIDNVDVTVESSQFSLQPGSHLVTYSVTSHLTGTSGFVSMRTKVVDAADQAIPGSLAFCGFAANENGKDFATTLSASFVIRAIAPGNYELKAARGAGVFGSVARPNVTGGLTDPDAGSSITVVRIR